MALGYSPKGSPQFAEAVDGSLAVIKNGGQIEPIVTVTPSASGPVFQVGDEAYAIVVAELDGGGNPTGNFTQMAAQSRSAALAGPLQ